MTSASVVFLAVALSGNGADLPSSRDVVLAMFDAFNRHDATAMAGLYAKDARLVSSDFCGLRVGQAEVMRTYRELFSAFPDIHDDVEQMVVEGDRVAIHFVARSGQGSSPLQLPISTFLTVRHGLIQSDESTFDTGGRPCTP